MGTWMQRRELTLRQRVAQVLAATVIVSASLVSGGEPTVLVTAGNSASSLAYSPDGKMLAVAIGSGDPAKACVTLWDVSAGRALRTLDGPSTPVATLAFLPDRRQLAATSSVPFDPIVRIWDLRTGRLQRTLDRHADAVEGVAFSPDGKQMATSSFDATVRFWKLDDGEEQQILEAPRMAKLGPPSISPDGMLAAVDTTTRQAIVWELFGGERQASYPADGNCAVFSPAGRLLALRSGELAVKLVESRNGRPVWLLRGHGTPIQYMAFSSDGKLLASADATDVRLWDVSSGKLSRILRFDDRKITAVALSPNGRDLAVADSRGQIRLWNVSGLPSK